MRAAAQTPAEAPERRNPAAGKQEASMNAHSKITPDPTTASTPARRRATSPQLASLIDGAKAARREASAASAAAQTVYKALFAADAAGPSDADRVKAMDAIPAPEILRVPRKPLTGGDCIKVTYHRADGTTDELDLQGGKFAFTTLDDVEKIRAHFGAEAAMMKTATQALETWLAAKLSAAAALRTPEMIKTRQEADRANRELGCKELSDLRDAAELALWRYQPETPQDRAAHAAVLIDMAGGRIGKNFRVSFPDGMDEYEIKLLVSALFGSIARPLASEPARDRSEWDAAAALPTAPDPALPILARIEELAALEDSADGDEATAYGDERDEQEALASTVQASSLTGAAGQIALAMHQIELVRGCGTQRDRDCYHGHAEDLLRSALGVLSDHLSPKMWADYVGGYHPSEVTAAQALIDAYESDGGHLCPIVHPETGAPTGVCVRIQARASERASQIEADLREPGVEGVVLGVLWKRTKEASDAFRRGEGVMGREAIREAWEGESAQQIHAAE
jgi:hypothetical protein